MNFTLQITTGTFLHQVTNRIEMLEKVNYCLNKLNIDKVIFGWSPNNFINEALIELLDKHGVEKYFWLPIFSDVRDMSVSDHSQDIRGRSNAPIQIVEGENFDFICQSSPINVNNAIKTFDNITAGLDVDGVFIDRIRYASAANSKTSLYGCWCPRCRENYAQSNIDLKYLEVLADTDDISKFVPDSLIDICYRFMDTNINKLFAVKRKTITQAVDGLCEAFRLRKMKIGIDTFAPVLADFVGQDLLELGKLVDFVKPMIYLRTYAPAGLPYEIDALGEKIACKLNKLWKHDILQMGLVEKAISTFSSKNIFIAPGIDVNRIEGICDATPNYVVDYINYIEHTGCQSIVLSWDALRTDKEMIDAIARH